MKTAPFLGLVLAATMASGLAYAQPGPGPDRAGFMQDRFAELDTNGDGTITRSEVETKIADDFAAADQDGNGSLSEDEASAFHEARHEQRRERRREHLGGGRFEQGAGEDGVIDQAEFTAHGLERFERADLDENGVVTQTEMTLVAEAMGGRHRGPRHGDHEPRHDRD